MSASSTLKEGLSLRAAGISVVPIMADGSKRPEASVLPDGKWEPYQTRLASEAEIRSWFKNGSRLGLGAVGGKISGHLEHLDFDEEAATVFPAFCELVEAEAPGLIGRLNIRQTPKPGNHVSYRCPEIEIPGNEKLAEKPNPNYDPGKPDGKDNPRRFTLIETRGEGGQCLVPSTPAHCHPSGREYTHLRGPELAQVQNITVAEWEILRRCATSFDQMPPPEPKKQPKSRGPGLSPGDDFNVRGPDFLDLMQGWEEVHRSGDVRYIRRPGKDSPGWSATLDKCTNDSGHPLLAVFSTNAAPFEGPANGKSCSCYSRFAVFTLLFHNGDFSAAAKDLSANGYGEKQPKVNLGPRPDPTKPPLAARWRRISDIKCKPIIWQWPSRIPFSMLSTLEGNPGLGKSFISLDLAARESTGRIMPPLLGKSSRLPGNVLLLTAEDTADHTIRPRLEALGADLDRIILLDDIGVDQEIGRPVMVPEDIPYIRDLIKQHKITFLIIDPLMAFLSPDVDANNDQDVRRAMYPLATLAAATGVAILLVRHLNKMIHISEALYRGGGSIGIIGAARSGLMIAKHPDDDHLRVVAQIKGNLCAEPDALVYSIEVSGPDATVKWHTPEGNGNLSPFKISGFKANDLLGKKPQFKRETEKVQQKNRDAAVAILDVLDRLDAKGEGMTVNEFHQRMAYGDVTIKRALADLLEHENVERIDVERKSGKGRTMTVDGYRRPIAAAVDLPRNYMDFGEERI
jgi:AAA domain/Bifunctional DNA primase/polymerase, N-terminal